MKSFPLWLKFAFIHLLLSFAPFALMAFFLITEYENLLGQLDTTGVESAVSMFRLNAGVLLSIFAVLIVIGTIIAIRIFTKPLVRLLEWIREAHRKKFSQDVSDAPILSADEIGELTHEVNEAIKYFREVGEREKAISKAKSEFISIAAHQLRTPLTSIRWVFSSLTQKKAGEIDARLPQIGLASTERIINLVNDLLNANSIEEGKFGLTLRKADLGPVIEQAVEEVRPIAESRKINITVIKETDSSQAFIDPERITLVLINLLSNAINYTSPEGTVSVKTKTRGDKVEVSVEDSGVGMSPEVQSRLFGKFFRAPEAILMHPDGSGLGLYIVKNIVARHGGKVMVKSEPGKGSIFSFELRTKESDLVRDVPFEQFFSSF